MTYRRGGWRAVTDEGGGWLDCRRICKAPAAACVEVQKSLGQQSLCALPIPEDGGLTLSLSYGRLMRVFEASSLPLRPVTMNGRAMPPAPEASLDARKLLLALFVDLATDKNYRNCFKAAHRELHQFFWRLKQDELSRPFVDNLLFDSNGNYPHCEQVDELLQEFQLSGVLSRPNPTYKYNDIAITEKSSSAHELKGTLSADQKTAYEEILQRFKRDLGVPAD